MSLRPCPAGEVPESTVRIAWAAFPKGCLAVRVRDELGPFFEDEQFVEAFPARGGPGLSPGIPAPVSVLQFAEGLSDRQAADAVRGRIDWKYGGGLGRVDRTVWGAGGRLSVPQGGRRPDPVGSECRDRWFRPTIHRRITASNAARAGAATRST
ncbi:hypothetical protein GCM10023075_26780 [Streptosporangium album]